MLFPLYMDSSQNMTKFLLNETHHILYFNMNQNNYILVNPIYVKLEKYSLYSQKNLTPSETLITKFHQLPILVKAVIHHK